MEVASTKPIAAIALLTTMSVLLAGCASHMKISHQDPTHKSLTVIIDGEEVGTLKFGKSKKKKLSKGMHSVKVVPEGQTDCPWTPDGQGWTIWIDQGAALTLFPPPNTDGTEDTDITPPAIPLQEKRKIESDPYTAQP